MLKADVLIHDTAISMPQVQPVEGVPVRIDVAFTDKNGKENRSVRKQAEKALKNLGPGLLKVMAPNEFVIYMAGACAPMSGVEQYTFGYMAQFVSRVMLVFTNQRLLAFRIDSNGKSRQSLRGCSLGDIKSTKLTGWLVRYMKLQYSDGAKENYWAMKSADKTKLKVILPKLLEACAGSVPAAQNMQQLCPMCSAALVKGVYECAGCGQKFRDEGSLWWRVLIPGAAYFYAKQTGIGLLHAIGDTIVTLEFLILWFAAVAAPAAEKTQDFWVGVGFVTFLLGFEKLIVLWHARRFVREYIPLDDASTMTAKSAG